MTQANQAARTPDLAVRVIRQLTRIGQTVACAESLTGGLVAAALTSVPGASAVVRGGVVSYATDLKASLLGVPADLLELRGAVDRDVAQAMASGVAGRLGATIGLATTGVAGPDPDEGKPVGMVFVAVSAPGGIRSRPLRLTGDRAAIRAATVENVLDLLAGVLPGEDGD